MPAQAVAGIAQAAIAALRSSGIPAESISSGLQKLELRVGEQRIWNLLGECERLMG